jgi:ABC-type Co2+ transport system permease subunit
MGGAMNSKQWTMVLWIVALINVFFGLYKLRENEPESALIHFLFALVIGFLAWRRKQKSS